MRCDLCGKPTRCSCKGGGCPSCGNNNKVIALMNDLIKFGLGKDIIRQKMSFIKVQLGKIDAYTLYEFLSDTITEEEYNEAVEKFNPNTKKKPQVKKSEVVDTTGRVNPERSCVFDGPGVWERCIYCNGIRKYMQGKECPKYQETSGTTVG